MSIKEKLGKAINSAAGLEIDKFMEIILSSQKDSYYRSKNPIGEDSDFITAPEISQMFGEMVGIWAIDNWNKLGKPSNLNLVEFGAGRGSLLKAFLKMAKIDPDFLKALSIYIIDIGEELIKIQKDALKEYSNISWIKSIKEVPNRETLVIANEFFDALPVKQYIKVNGKLYERIIIKKGDELAFSAKEISNKKIDKHTNFSDNSIFEESPISQKYIADISSFIAKNRGSALIIDYGYDIDPKSRGNDEYKDTLQAIKRHKYVSVFDYLGEADLTCQVDFNALKAEAKKQDIEAFGTITQANFLLSHGIDIRLQNLQKLNPNLSHILAKQYHRLVAPNEMGNLFKALILHKL